MVWCDFTSLSYPKARASWATVVVLNFSPELTAFINIVVIFGFLIHAPKSWARVSYHRKQIIWYFIWPGGIDFTLIKFASYFVADYNLSLMMHLGMFEVRSNPHSLSIIQFLEGFPKIA